VDDDRITVAHIGDHLCQFGAVQVFSRGLVFECAVNINAGKLPIGFLVERTHSHIADNLSRHLPMLSLCCRKSER
jgi:hypothetical protein